MMAWEGVISLTYEFILSLVILCGSGFLIYSHTAPEVASTAIGAVITFWFTRRMVTENNQQQNKQQPPGETGTTPTEQKPPA